MARRPTLPAIPAVGGLGLGLLVVARIADGLPVGDRVVGPALGPRDYVVRGGSGPEALRSPYLATMVRAFEDDSTEVRRFGRARSRTTATLIVVAPRHPALLSPGAAPSRGRGCPARGGGRALGGGKETPRSRPEEILPETPPARRPEPSERARRAAPSRPRPGGPSPSSPDPETLLRPLLHCPSKLRIRPRPAPGCSHSGPRGYPEAGVGGQSSLGPGGIPAGPRGRDVSPGRGLLLQGA